MSSLTLIPQERIDSVILFMRGQKVLLDNDLAFLYGVEVRTLNQAVKRNIERFPEDFMFQLTEAENETILKSQIVISSDGKSSKLLVGRSNLKSQFVISNLSKDWGGRRKLPYAFTEQGIAMLSSVLKSPRAIAVNIEIMRAFMRLRQIIDSHADLARKLDALEQKYEHHDHQFKIVFDAIRELMTPPTPEEKRREIGFGAHWSPPPAENPKFQNPKSQ